MKNCPALLSLEKKIYIYIYIYTHKCTRAHTHTHTHTYIYIYKGSCFKASFIKENRSLSFLIVIFRAFLLFFLC